MCRVDPVAADLQIPDFAVAIIECEGQAVLTRRPIRMHAADIAFPIDPEVVVSRQEILSDKLADDRRQAPQEQAHWLVIVAVDLIGGALEHHWMLFDAAERYDARTNVFLDAGHESTGEFRRD